MEILKNEIRDAIYAYHAFYRQETRFGDAYHNQAEMREIGDAKEAIDIAYLKLDSDLSHLLTLCRILAQNPMIIATRNYQPILRADHDRQTYLDALTQQAGELATLDRYTARYKMPDGSHGYLRLAQSPTPASSPQALPDPIEQVRQRSKALYGRPLTTEPPPKPGQPPVNRSNDFPNPHQDSSNTKTGKPPLSTQRIGRRSPQRKTEE